jgi:hypothetical protein
MNSDTNNTKKKIYKMNDDDGETSHVEILNETNYVTWAFDMRSMLLKKKVWDVVMIEPVDPRGVNPTPDEEAVWEIRNGKMMTAMGILSEKLPRRHQKELYKPGSNMDTPHKVWMELERDLKRIRKFRCSKINI